MDKYLTGGKAILVSALLCTTMLGSSALAESIDFTASTHINRGTCTLSTGSSGLAFDFKDVTPVVAFGATKSVEKSFQLKSCVAVNSMSLSLSSTSTTNIASGTYQGKWVVPVSGGATGVAFKTEIKNGSGSYYKLQADDKAAATGTEKYKPETDVYIKTTIVPTVGTYGEMKAGSLASTAVLNITYL
ncbi:MAG: hypothetical protein RR742_16320 [Citrobacter sp.]|uniref:hypothetical protein n=1 Tax=Citrobacter sp. TaxID=1896336 RepID=UPI002FCC34A1